MCTATFIRDEENRIVFTTNRDEHQSRPTLPPQIHEFNNLKILFPQDQLAGGSWVAVSEKGLISCLMNGAEGEYEWRGTIAEKSRGQVLLDSFQYENSSEFLEEGLFEKSHPFTLLRIHPNNDQIHAIKWNGHKKWLEEFKITQPQIWSAYTLYPEEQRLEREKMFHQWIKENKVIDADSIWKVHQSSRENKGLLLQGNDAVNTVSTTQLRMDQHQCVMVYDEINTSVKKEVSLKRK